MRILVTGGGGSAASNFVDALRQADREYEIVAVDTRPYHLQLIDADAKFLVPSVQDPAYVETMNRIIAAQRIDFVHAQPDVEVAFLARNAERVDARLFLPPADEIELCHDKMAFHATLAAAGAPVPEAHHLRDAESVDAAVGTLLAEHPRVWVRAIRGAGARASLPVTSAAQAHAWIDYWHDHQGLRHTDFMASEFLPGREFAWQSLWFEGELVTSQARERIEYIFGNLTPSGQTSSPSVARTVNRDDVNAAGEQAVRAISGRPHGVHCVDMKEDRSGRPRVTEINAGRFFTTSNFFAHAGLNMPDMYVRLGCGEDLEPSPPRHNPLPEELYWVRMIDMGFALVSGAHFDSAPA